MKNLNLTAKQCLYCLFLFSIIFSAASCSKDVEGCTISEATNFNADANVDDKSCTFHRDTYVAAYGTDAVCNGGAMTSPSLRIMALAEDFTSVYIELEGFSIMEATVNDTQLTLPLQNVTWNGEPGYQIRGTAIFEGNILKLSYTLTSPGPSLGELNCVVSAVKK